MTAFDAMTIARIDLASNMSEIQVGAASHAFRIAPVYRLQFVKARLRRGGSTWTDAPTNVAKTDGRVQTRTLETRTCDYGGLVTAPIPFTAYQRSRIIGRGVQRPAPFSAKEPRRDGCRESLQHRARDCRMEVAPNPQDRYATIFATGPLKGLAV